MEAPFLQGAAPPVLPCQVLVDLVELAGTPQGRALGFPEMMVAYLPIWDGFTAQQRADRVGGEGDRVIHGPISGALLLSHSVSLLRLQAETA